MLPTVQYSEERSRISNDLLVDNVLYWGYKVRGVIVKYDLEDGSFAEVLRLDSNSVPFSLAVSEDKIYWSDNKSRELHIIDQHSENNAEIKRWHGDVFRSIFTVRFVDRMFNGQ